ncbi:MAG: tetratricopeptide repeat protein, partial [Candidatus Aminicenantales bacterium]
EDEKAVEVFNRILTSRPQETEARIKLGRIHVRNKQYDEAFEVLEPLVENLFQKHREEQAVGVLGLILVQNRGHCPTLEKLASLYREKGQKKNLEIVGRRLLREYREQGEDSKARVIGEELARLFPEKPEYAPYAAQETEAVAEPEAQEEAPAEELTEQTPAPEEAVEAPEYELEKGLAQADLYLDQGLIRNAKRILEHLRMQYPEDPRIAQKMESLSSLAAQVKEEELVQRIEKASERETDLFESGEKLTAAEIFADTDIIPLVTEETGEKRYYDLSRQIEEELQAIQNISSRQARGDTPLDEKELPVIVAEFRKKVDEKVGTADLELRYNLGIAYLEQGLLDEAKREFELASEDPRWKIESFTNLAECSKRQDSLDQALEWYQKALEEAGEETVQGFVLKYEMASLLEARGDAARALELYRDVKKWNPEYADVAEKIQSLEKQASSSSR